MKRKSSAQIIIDFIWWLFLQPSEYKARRNRCPRYQARLRHVKRAWTIVGLVMLGILYISPGSPGLAGVIFLGFVTTFGAFMFLDEHQMKEDET